jgi:hypothetical protein
LPASLTARNTALGHGFILLDIPTFLQEFGNPEESSVCRSYPFGASASVFIRAALLQFVRADYKSVQEAPGKSPLAEIHDD